MTNGEEGSISTEVRGHLFHVGSNPCGPFMQPAARQFVSSNDAAGAMLCAIC